MPFSRFGLIMSMERMASVTLVRLRPPSSSSAICRACQNGHRERAAQEAGSGLVVVALGGPQPPRPFDVGVVDRGGGVAVEVATTDDPPAVRRRPVPTDL